jgi:hypothetical protein
MVTMVIMAFMVILVIKNITVCKKNKKYIYIVKNLRLQNWCPKTLGWKLPANQKLVFNVIMIILVIMVTMVTIVITVLVKWLQKDTNYIAHLELFTYNMTYFI